MKLNIQKSVVVITPTVGNSKLLDAVESVKNQTYKNIKHLIVVDGLEFLPKVGALSLPTVNNGVLTVTPNNTGAKGYYGHRIYAAYPQLVDEDYVAFLDEDNWYKPNHIESLVDLIESNNYDWVHSLRSIYSEDKSFVVDDNCEALGKYPIYGNEKNGHLVDTSSFLFNRSFIIRCSGIWHHGWGGDRNFLNVVGGSSRWDGTGEHTLCYRLDGNPNSPKKEFFIQGNTETDKIYNSNLVWNKK